MTLAALARKMIVSKQNMTGMVSRLRDAGYLDKNEDPSDLRSARVVLTRRGRTLVEKMRPAYDEWRKELARAVGETELDELERIVRLLIEELQPR